MVFLTKYSIRVMVKKNAQHMKKTLNTIQAITDALFEDFKTYYFGEPFVRSVIGFPGNTVIQPIKIDGQYLFIGLHRDRYISRFIIIGGSIGGEHRIDRKQVAFILFGGKICGILGKQTFKNKFYYDSKGKIDADQQEGFLHATATAMSRLDVINRNRQKVMKKELKIEEVPVLTPIPDKLPRDIRSLLMNL